MLDHLDNVVYFCGRIWQWGTVPSGPYIDDVRNAKDINMGFKVLAKDKSCLATAKSIRSTVPISLTGKIFVPKPPFLMKGYIFR